MNPQTSVIVPVYNAVRALELVLAGYERQTAPDFELFIADDGSGPEVRDLVEKTSQSAPFPIRYVFQPDEGFRRSRILNEAVRVCAGSYLVFADADCIPHSRFVAAHQEGRTSRTVLCGRRVLLSRAVSESLTPERVLRGVLESITPGRILDAIFGRGGHWDEGFLIRNSVLHRLINCKEPYLLGSNFSLDKSLLEEINGFNEDFIGYGGEDTELEFRLRLVRARFLWVRHRAIQYHLFHEARSGSPANLSVLERTRIESRAACRRGLRNLET